MRALCPGLDAGARLRHSGPRFPSLRFLLPIWRKMSDPAPKPLATWLRRQLHPCFTACGGFCARFC
ncbi:hypothetical protein ACFQ4K_17185 [Tistrella bauzanensis]